MSFPFKWNQTDIFIDLFCMFAVRKWYHFIVDSMHNKNRLVKIGNIFINIIIQQILVILLPDLVLIMNRYFRDLIYGRILFSRIIRNAECRVVRACSLPP